MLLLPIEYVVYKTKLTEEEVLKRLKNNIEQQKRVNLKLFSLPEKEYQGKIIGQKFKVQRVSFAKDTLLPVIIGIIENAYDGDTIIKVKMRLTLPEIIFLGFWCVFFLFMLFNFKVGEGFEESLSFLLFGYGFIMLIFKFETFNSKKDLKRIFEAEIIKDNLTF